MRHLLVGLLSIFLVNVGWAAKPAEMPPLPVEAISVKQTHFQPTLRISANVRAVEQISVRSELAGIVKAFPQPEGGLVKKDTVIVELGSSQQQAEFDQQRAAYELAVLDFDRFEKLFKQGTATQHEFDQKYSHLKQTHASLALAKARLEKTQIKAPFEGRLGVYEVNPGQMIQAGDLVTYLVDNRHLRVEFYVPQQHSQLITIGQKIAARVPHQADKTLIGTIKAIESRFDPVTHLRKGYALLDNPEELLLSGMALTMEAYLTPRDAILIPLSAISEKGQTATVYVVDEKGQVVIKPVQIGERAHDQVEVITGLSTGEWVIIAGQHKLYPGQSVKLPTVK